MKDLIRGSKVQVGISVLKRLAGVVDLSAVDKE